MIKFTVYIYTKSGKKLSYECPAPSKPELSEKIQDALESYVWVTSPDHGFAVKSSEVECFEIKRLI